MSCKIAAIRRVTVDSCSTPGMQGQPQLDERTFPFKLYEMIEYACNSEFSSCISWSADGSAFIIYDKNVLMNGLAPKFFNQSKFRSFTRQLNIWGFYRTETVGGRGDGWRHDNFLRGQPHLLKDVERTQVKSLKRSSSNAKAQALSRQAQIAAQSLQNAAFLSNQSNLSTLRVMSHVFQSSNTGGNDNNYLERSNVVIPTAAATQPQIPLPIFDAQQDRRATLQHQFSNLPQERHPSTASSSIPTSLPTSRDEIATQVGSTLSHHAQQHQRTTLQHYSNMTEGESCSIPMPLVRSSDEIATEGGTTEQTKHSDSVTDTPNSSSTAVARTAQPFDDHELSFIDSIFGREDKAPEEDLSSILSIDQEHKKKD